jgi:cytidine kinase
VSAPDVVVFGNLLLDDIVFPDGRTRMGQPGGAVLYFALGAALWGLRVGVVSVLGDDYPDAALQALRERGIDLEGARPLGGPSLRTWLLYEGRVRRVVHRLDGPSFPEASPVPADLPASWRDARLFHVAPLPVERQMALVNNLPRGNEAALASLDPYLVITRDEKDKAAALAQHVDVFLLSEDEFFVPHDRRNPGPALEWLRSRRLKQLVLKQGANGGWLRDAEGWRQWQPKAEQVVDSTGAGDSFAAGFLAGVLAGEAAQRCVERGIVTSSFAIADWGADDLLRATPRDAERRLAAWFPG